MECPICGSTAVVARTCLTDAIEKIQAGIDPYDLLCAEDSEAECRACGHVFIPESTP